MDLDVLEQLEVARGTAEANLGVRSSTCEPALLHEHLPLLRVDDLDQVVVGRQPPARPQPRHVGVDRLEPALPGNRNSVVAVDDEVRVAQLVDDDRREIVVRERLLDSTHARDDGRSQRTELAVEVTAAAVGPHDLR